MRGRGAESEGRRHNGLAPSPVALMRDQSYWMGSFKICPLSTPSRDCEFSVAKTPPTIPPPKSLAYQGYCKKGCLAFVVHVQ